MDRPGGHTEEIQPKNKDHRERDSSSFIYSSLFPLAPGGLRGSETSQPHFQREPGDPGAPTGGFRGLCWRLERGRAGICSILPTWAIPSSLDCPGMGRIHSSAWINAQRSGRAIPREMLGKLREKRQEPVCGSPGGIINSSRGIINSCRGIINSSRGIHSLIPRDPSIHPNEGSAPALLPARIILAGLFREFCITGSSS